MQAPIIVLIAGLVHDVFVRLHWHYGGLLRGGLYDRFVV